MEESLWHKSPAAAVPSETWVLVAFRRSEISIAMLVSTVRGECFLAHRGSLFLKGKPRLQCYLNPLLPLSPKVGCCCLPNKNPYLHSWRSRGRDVLAHRSIRPRDVTKDPTSSSTWALSLEALPFHDHKVASSGHKGRMIPRLFTPKMRGKCSTQSMDSQSSSGQMAPAGPDQWFPVPSGLVPALHNKYY